MDSSVRDGRGYPFVVGPLCASCGVPVEEFRIYLLKHGDVGVDMKCHGKLQRVKLTHKEIAETTQIVAFVKSNDFKKVAS